MRALRCECKDDCVKTDELLAEIGWRKSRLNHATKKGKLIKSSGSYNAWQGGLKSYRAIHIAPRVMRRSCCELEFKI